MAASRRGVRNRRTVFAFEERLRDDEPEDQPLLQYGANYEKTEWQHKG